MLEPGKAINNWRIEAVLGQGVYGSVYQVTKIKSRTNKKKSFALKCESEEMAIQFIEHELMVLVKLFRYRIHRHIPLIVDFGRFEQADRPSFKYIVMTLLGQTLKDLMEKYRFSLPTVLGTCIQCIEAIEDLHKTGFLHRDIKTANFCIGRAELRGGLHRIYIIDFGMTRNYIKEDGRMRRPRESIGFRGTMKYAPMGTHNQRELCRKDDIESLLYLFVEMAVGKLPWAEISHTPDILKMKKELIGNGLLIKNCPKQFQFILKDIIKAKFYDEPDYKGMYASLNNGLDKKFLFDWEKDGEQKK